MTENELTVQASPVMVGLDMYEGRLVFWHGGLVAVLVALFGSHYEELEGYWFLETGLGPCAERDAEAFMTLKAALDWISQTLAKSDSATN